MAAQTEGTFVIDDSHAVGADLGPLDLERDYDFLKNLTKQVRDKFVGEWMGSQLRGKINQQTLQHTSHMEQQEEKLAALTERLHKLTERKHENKKALAVQEEEVVSVQEQLLALKQELDELLRQKEQAQETLASSQEENAKEKQSLEKERQSTMETTAELEKAATWFQERLGLQFKKVTGNRIQLVFTCIDKGDPSRPFCFCVKINPDRTYSVSDCEPPVAEFEDLVEKLNKTNNFKGFVASMRRKFKDLV